MNEIIRCIGCGSVLQSEKKGQPGYLPERLLKNAVTTPEASIYCQRCFRLRHYNEIQPVDIAHHDFLALLNTLASKKALIVNVVDLFDFNNSLIPSLKRFIGENDFILVGNKSDLFSTHLKETKIKDWMRQEANRAGLKPKKIFLVSAQKQHHLLSLIDELKSASRHQDIYFVGATNVGKSTLVNQIIGLLGEDNHLITTSRFPGTTLDQIKIPLDTGHFLIDTPGILVPSQLVTHLDAKELDKVMPHKTLRPINFQLEPQQTLFLAGLGRIDFVSGDPCGFTVYAARDLYVHRTKTMNADQFYETHLGDLLSPPQKPSELPPFRSQTYRSTVKSDLLFGGIAFVTVPAGIVVKTYTPGGIGQGIRRALI